MNDDNFESLKEMLASIDTSSLSSKEDTITINIEDYVVSDDWSIDSSNYSFTPPLTSITIGDNFSMGANNSLEVDGNIVCKDKNGNTIDVGDTLSAIQQRLAILTPDPAKLDKWEALREAYEHYKSLEALIGEENDGD